ncbi:hypothetical protein D3C71_1113710 [compost metagenome]
MIATAGPAVGDRLRGRATVDVDHHRVALGRIETGRLDQAVVQFGLAVGGGQGAELDRALRIEIARIRMRRVFQIVLDQGGDLLAVGTMQRDLRRRGGVGPAVHVDAGVAREAGGVHARGLRQTLRRAALQ